VTVKEEVHKGGGTGLKNPVKYERGWERKEKTEYLKGSNACSESEKYFKRMEKVKLSKTTSI